MTASNMELNFVPLFTVAMPDPAALPFAKAARIWDQGVIQPRRAGAALSLPTALTFIWSPSSVVRQHITGHRLLSM